MVVIGPELVSEALREKADVPFNLMEVGNAHLDGGKQVVKGDVLSPIHNNGVVMARCRDATNYITKVGPRCILGFPFFSRYGIQVNIDPPCFRFTEFQDVSAPPHSEDNLEITGPAPPIRVQTRESIGGCFTSSPPVVDSSAMDPVTESALPDSEPDVASVCACMPDSSSFAQLDTDKVIERIQGDPPRVLEVPLAQVFNSLLPFILVLAAVCSASGTMCMVGPRNPATRSYKTSALDDTSGRSVSIPESSIPDIDSVLQGRTSKAGQEPFKRDVSHLRLIAHVDCPLFDPLTQYALFCMSAAILLYSPTPRRSDVRCITPLFEKHELMLYEILRTEGDYLPLMTISGSRTGPHGEDVLWESSAGARSCSVHSNSPCISLQCQNSGLGVGSVGGMNTNCPSAQNSDTCSADQNYFRSAHKKYDSDNYSESYSEDEGSLGYTQPPDEFMGRFGYSRDRAGQEFIDQVPTQVLTPDFNILLTASGSTETAVTAGLDNPAKTASLKTIGANIHGRVKLVPSRPKRRRWWQIHGLYNLSGNYNQELTPTKFLQGRYALTSDWCNYLIDWAGPQFSPSVFPFAAPASRYRRKGKLVCQPAGGKKSNGGFNLPWGGGAYS